jgi:hypothetical protein
MMRIRGKGKDDSRGGAQDLIVLGTHVLDMMRAVAGDPLWAFGHVRQDDRDITRSDVKEGAEHLGPIGGNNLTGYYVFPNSVAGSFDSYVSKGSGRFMGIWIEGTEGRSGRRNWVGKRGSASACPSGITAWTATRDPGRSSRTWRTSGWWKA